MDKIILALLFLKTRTLYDLKTKITSDLSLMYSSSTGSIQSAIKKLLAQGFIDCEETVEESKYKKIYHITESGRTELQNWLNSPFEPARNKNPELAKLYFMGLSDKKERCQRIKEYINSLENYHKNLQAVYGKGLSLTPPPEYSDLFKFQLLTAKFGVDTSAYEIMWLKKLLSELSESEELNESEELSQ